MKNLHPVKEDVRWQAPDRRKQIVDQIKQHDACCGKVLAAAYDVKPSGDRAGHSAYTGSRIWYHLYEQGYIINEPAAVSRVFKVKHTDAQVEELTEIIDLGGIVRNVMVNHRVYGHMEAEINITSRRKVTEFMDDIQNRKSSPLKILLRIILP